MSDAYNYDTGSTGEEAEEELAAGSKPKKKAPAKAKTKRPSRKAPARKNEPDGVADAAQNQIKSFVDRVERLESERSDIGADIKEVYAEAKAFGLDTKVLRKVVAARKQDRQEREEQQALFELYWNAVEGYVERSDSDERGERG